MIEKKINKVLAEIKNSRLDALLLSNPTNIAYLTGFKDVEGGYLLITCQEKPIYFTNFLYRDEAIRIKDWKVIVSRNNMFEQIENEVKRLKLTKLGFEAKYMSYIEQKKIKNMLSQHQISFIETIDLIEGLRQIKTVDELKLMKKSIAITARGLEFAKKIHNPELTEKELSIEVEKFLKLNGDYNLAFTPIVAAGKNSAYPHHLGDNTKLKNYFLLDLGSKYHGYCADLTRVFFWGKMPARFKQIYDIVKTSRDLAIKHIKDGVTAQYIDKVARDYIENKGFGKYFGHGLGHGVGLVVHEPPFLTPKSTGILKEGMVVTIEPAIYLPNKFGVRVEDMVLVTAKKAEVLNEFINW